MRIFKIKVYFLKDILKQPEIVLVKNDYNSVEFDFEFDIENGKKVFELKKPDGTPFIKDIVDNKIVLTDYDEEGNVILIVDQAGEYNFEIVCYDENSKITATQKGKFNARDEVVNIDEDELSKDSRITILDSLINETIEATNNSKEQAEYAKSQGDYAKEQAESVISANSQATEIINEFKSDVDNYTTSFNENADNIEKSYNDNHQTKMSDYNKNATSKKNEYNTNHTNKLKSYNDNDLSKITAYNQNHDSKIGIYNTNHDNKLNSYNMNDIEKTNSYNSNHTSKMNIYDENHVEKLGIYNSNHEEKMNAYNENHDIKMNEFNNEVDDIKSDLEDCYKNQIVGQVSGTSIYVDDSADARMRTLDIDGALKQETTKGINLIDFSKPTRTLLTDGTFSFENNTLEIKNNSAIYQGLVYTITDLITENKGKKIAFYYESFLNDIVEHGSPVQLQIMYNDKTPNSYPFLVNYSGIRSAYIIPENTDNIRIVELKIFSNNNNVDLPGHLKITKPMLYFGTATDEVEYEKYTGGIASPNPDYPSNIEVVEGTVEAKVINRNLIKNELTSKTLNGVTVTVNEDKSVSVKGVIEKSFTLYLFKNKQSFLKKNTEYTLSQKCTIPKGAYFRIQNSSNTDYFYGIGSKDEVSSASLTFTHNKDLNDKIDCILWFGSYSVGQNVDFTLYPQLEEGNKETEYTPYQEDSITINLQGNFVAKINDEIKDTLRIGNGHAILTKKVGKILLNGSETINKSSNNNYFSIIKDVPLTENGNTIYPIISDYFISKKFNWIYSGECNYGISFVYNISRIAIRHKDISTVEEFKQWLSEHNVELYYELEQPYEVDLGPVKLPKTFKGVSNIFLNASLETNFKVDYVKDTQLVIDDLQSQINNINSLLSTTETSALLLDNLQSDLEREVI